MTKGEAREYRPLLFLAHDLKRHDVFDAARSAHQAGRAVYVITHVADKTPIRWEHWLRRQT